MLTQDKSLWTTEQTGARCEPKTHTRQYELCYANPTNSLLVKMGWLKVMNFKKKIIVVQISEPWWLVKTEGSGITQLGPG